MAELAREHGPTWSLLREMTQAAGAGFEPRWIGVGPHLLWALHKEGTDDELNGVEIRPRRSYGGWGFRLGGVA